MKCAICKENVEETFLKKKLGTFIKDSKGKRHLVCRKCQENLDNDKSSMLKEMGKE